MFSIQVNNYNYVVKSNLSIIEACKYVGIVLPRFCYHEKLTVAASCRMCVVEVEKLPKPVTACSSDILSNLTIFTDTPFLQKARENVLEALLLNHPLDCPICDQAGECDLQDQVKVFGSFYSRFYKIKKLTVEDKYCGPLIKTIMTRCIMCTRCVRFGSEIAGIDFLGTLNRGGASEIGSYVSKLFDSEISGNVIDLCPVGALTANNYAFKARPWELRTIDSIDTLDNLGSNIYLNFKESQIMRVLPKVNENINENWISDKTRFSYDAISSDGRYHSTHLDLERGSTSVALDFFNSNLKQTSFLINEEVDLELLGLLDNLTRLGKGIKVCSISDFNIKENFNISWGFDRIKSFNCKIRNCFVFTSNVKVENALINTKLRVKFLHKNFDVISFGLTTKSNFPVNCLNLSIQNLLLLLEGRYPCFSFKIFSLNPLFIFGGGFNKRLGVSNKIISNFVKFFFPTALIYRIGGSANTSSCYHFGVKSLNKNVFLKSSSYVLCNLDYNLKLKKVFDFFSILKSSKFLLVFNPYKVFVDGLYNSFNKDLSFVAIPSLNSIEFNGIYLNLEERPQETQGLKDFSSAATLRNCLFEFFLSKKGFIEQTQVITSIGKENFLSYIPVLRLKDSLRLSYIYELVDNCNLFDSIQKFLSIKRLLNYIKCSKYPFKSSVDDFYITNNFLRNSPTMLECSRESRKLFDNF
jgi:NADH-quinone oxidoreductase chain G